MNERASKVALSAGSQKFWREAWSLERMHVMTVLLTFCREYRKRNEQDQGIMEESTGAGGTMRTDDGS